MSLRDRVATDFDLNPRTGVVTGFFAACAFLIVGCTGGSGRELDEVLSSDLPVGADSPVNAASQLRPGVYLVEVRERDIDLRVAIEAAGTRLELEDGVQRHGLLAEVVRLRQPAELHIQARSADYGGKTGSAHVRVSRWKYSVDAAPGALENGYAAFGAAGRETARGEPAGWERAAEQLRRASALFANASSEGARAQAEYSLGSLEYLLRMQWQAAIRAADAAADEYESLDDRTGWHRAGVLRASAEIEIASGMSASSQRAERGALFESIDKRLREAAAHFGSHGEPVDEAYAINMRGVGFFSAGDDMRAAEFFAQASELARRNQDSTLLVKTLSNLAWIHQRRGEIARAAGEYAALMPLLDRDRDADMYATTITNYGQCLIALGEFDRALSLHTQALEVFSARGSDADRGRQLNALGGLYIRVGELERALSTLRAAIEVHARVGAGSARATALRMAGNVSGELGDPRAALAYLRESMEQDAQPDAVARTRVLIAAQLRALGDLRGAERELVEAQRDGNELTRADALTERARLRRAQRDFPAALADARAADALYVSLGLDFDRIETHTLMSQSLVALGDAGGALGAADAAITIEQRIRVGSANPEWRARFLAERYTPYEARIAAQLAAGGDDAVWRAFQTTETVRARSLADQLAAREHGGKSVADPAGNALRAQLTAQQLRLESRMDRANADPAELSELRRSIEEIRARIDANSLRQQGADGSVATAAHLPGDLREVQDAIPSDTAVLTYFVGDETSHAWVLTRGTLRHATLARRAELQRTADAFVAASRGGVATSAARDAGRSLLGALLDNVTAKRLLVIADGPLNGVPFAALQSGSAAGSGVLVERFVISYAPSLALAMHASPRPTAAPTRVAVISDPVYAQDDSRLHLAASGDASSFRSDEQPRDKLTRLPYSALEGRTVARAFAGSHTIEISGFDATPERVLELRTQPLSVLHFATHALARRDAPEQSALYLSEYGVNGAANAESRLTADEIARTGLRADLVVLSACATGDGGAVRGEGVLGLTYAFLANGSRSVVASLWPIQDASTARFMKEFYDAYRKSGRAADALRAAQLHERNGAAWTSFVVRANEFP